MLNNLGLKTYPDKQESKDREALLGLFRECPIPDDEMLQNLGLFIDSKLLARILFMHHIYLLQLNVHGVIMDFGARWGQNMAIFSALRGIYEPFNKYRKVVGFDTFEGLETIDAKDGNSDAVKLGGYSVTKNYERYLEHIVECLDRLNPIAHIKKCQVVKGDAVHTLEDYLSEHPETVVSLAFFDFGLYRPTLECLRLIVPYLGKGSVVGFDEICDETFPGETIAVREVFGSKFVLERLPIARSAYIVC